MTRLRLPNEGSGSGARPRRPSATQIILKAASLIRERVNEMAIAMTLEQGKPIEQARLEILRGCDIIEWDATEGLRMYGRVIPSEERDAAHRVAATDRPGRGLLALEFPDELAGPEGGGRICRRAAPSS